MIWPALPIEEWKPTLDTLQRWTQIAGKIKLQLCPFLNEWWHVALYPSARGLTTSTIPHAEGVFEIRFDFARHLTEIATSAGKTACIGLYPRSVADFYAEVMSALRWLELDVRINTVPDEVEDRTPFERDTTHAAYDRTMVECWWTIVRQTSRLFEIYRAGFTGKNSPVHLWWGGFDLNQTRFNGRAVAPPAGANRMMRLAEDEENVAVGFWPGDGARSGPVYYSYLYPEPPGVRDAEIQPGAARFEPALGEFILSYEDVRLDPDPERAILTFLRSAYEAQAAAAGWDREKLERQLGLR